MKAIVGTISFLLGAAVFVVGVRGDYEASGEALLYLGMLAITIAGLFYVSTTRRIMPGLIIVVLFGLAYAPGASDSMTRGIIEGPIPATPEAARTAIVTLALFLLSVVALLVWWTDSRAATSVADRAVQLISAGNHRVFSMGLAGMFLITLIVSFRSGSWSYYGGTAADVKAGGLRLELLYEPMLLSTFAVLGRYLGRAVWQVPFSAGRMMLRLLPWLVLLGLLFIVQSRRLMVTAMIITAVDPFVFILKHRADRALPLMRIAVAGAAGLALMLALFAGSALWRASVNDSGERASRWDDQIEHTIIGMSTTSLDTTSTMEATAARFTYLWIDAVSIDQSDILGSFGDLWDVLSADIATATPEILFPEKYKSPPIRCESAFAAAGVSTDLSCTAIAEAALFGHGSVVGFAAVIALFALGLTISSLAHRQGSDAGLVLSCIMLQPFSTIETGAFPIVIALRNLLITGGFLALATWLLRLLVRGGDQRRVESLADVA